MSSVLLGNREYLFEKEKKIICWTADKILSIFLWDVYFEEWKLRFSFQATNNKCTWSKVKCRAAMFFNRARFLSGLPVLLDLGCQERAGGPEEIT